MKRHNALALTGAKILATLKENQEALNKHKVKRIGLFGSYASGKQHAKSDIDFVVEFEEPTFDNFMGLCEYLENLFQRKVEVLTPHGVESITIKSVADEIKRTVIYA